MRRLASFLQGKRTDRAESLAPPVVHETSPPTPSSSTTSLPKVPRRPPGRPKKKRSTELPPHVRLEPAPPSSSSTTSDSPSLLTPADSDGSHSMTLPSTVGASWKQIFKGRKQPLATTPTSGLPEEWITQWQPASSQDVPIHSPPKPRRQPTPLNNVNQNDDDTDYDTSSTASSDEDTPLALSRRLSTAPPASRARSYLYALTLNAGRSQPSTPPVLSIPNTPLFPRSSNLSKTLRPTHTLEVGLHRATILQRSAPSQVLTSSQEASIASLGTRPPLALLQPEGKRSDDVETITEDAKRLGMHSVGLAAWIRRPMFEERMMLWLPSSDPDGGLAITRVPGHNRAVAALEFSEGLQALVEFTESDPIEVVGEPPLTAASSASSAFDFMTPPEYPVDVGARPVLISPVIVSASPALPPRPGSPTSVRTSVSVATIKITNSADDGPQTPRKRGVHFAESGEEAKKGERSEDGTVLQGYAERMRKQKEEKARFLREEAQRRAHDALSTTRGRAEVRVVDLRAMQQLEEQRRLLEEERRKLEDERRAWEKQKKAEEEERRVRQEAARQRQYADEVAAARARREGQRKGHTISPYAPITPRRQASDITASSSRSLYSRPTYDDGRRQATDSAVQPQDLRDHSPAGGSSDSHQGSLFGSTPGSSQTSYNGSAEDINRSMKAARRASTISNATNRSSMYGTMHMGFPQQGYFPPMPVFPVDMPLLPPNAPFMHQSGRRSSRNSSPQSRADSPSSKLISLPQSHSSESLNRERAERRHTSRPHLTQLQTWNGSERHAPSSAPPTMLVHPVNDRRASQVPSIPSIPSSARSIQATTYASMPVRAPSSSSKKSSAAMPSRRRTFAA